MIYNNIITIIYNYFNIRMNNSSSKYNNGYYNGYYDGSVMGYQNGHLHGYIMSAKERDTTIEQLKSNIDYLKRDLTKLKQKEIRILKEKELFRQKAEKNQDTLNRQLLDGLISIGIWLGKNNEPAYKMMLIRGGVPENIIEDIF